MNIHEYQGKSILKSFGVAVQEGIVADTPVAAVAAAAELSKQTGTKWWVVKAQIHAGGRGKGGGVKLAKTLDEVTQTPYAYDPKKAQQLLADAGVKPGTEIDLIWQPTGGPQVKEITDAIISYWSAVGLKVKNDQQESGVWLDNLIKLNWDADLQTNGVLTGDADFTLRRLYVSTANRNGYANPDLDKILNDAASATDQKQRATLYAQALKIIWDDAVGLFPVDLLENYVYSKKVSGFVAPPSGIPFFGNVTVQK